jgi:hypothetical protein
VRTSAAAFYKHLLHIIGGKFWSTICWLFNCSFQAEAGFQNPKNAESARTSGSCNRCRVKEKQKCNGRHCKFENRSHVVGRLPMQKKGSKKLTQ